MKNRSGVASLIIVFIVSMILVFVVLVWQSRLLLAVHRSVGLTDSLLAEYNAETEINDILGRFLGDYPIPAAGTKSLADGTILTTTIDSGGDIDTLSVLAKRQFATNRFIISRSKTMESVASYDSVEIVLGMDCTRSMDRNANPGCIGSGCESRISSAKRAALSFLDEILALPPDERSKYLVGVEVFRIGALWLSTPTNGLVGLRQMVNDGFGNRISNSSACVISDPSIPGSGETSLGKAMIFADDYLNSNSDTRKKQVYILVTDGLPNVSLEDSRCGTVNCRSVDGGACTTRAIDYLICGMADTTTEWRSGFFGLRSAEVDVYGVTVMSLPANVNEQIAYDQTVTVFSDPDYVKRYFNSTNAENLPGILQDIFGEISQDMYQFRIEKVIPTL